LVVITQKLNEGGKSGKRWKKGGRKVVVKAAWDGICSKCLTPVVEGEAMNVRTEKENVEDSSSLICG